jgi:plasmid maintenance system antidote protein VapI
VSESAADQLYPYDPDWVMAPGAMLDEWRTDHGVSPGMAARIIGIDQARYDRLVAGDEPLDGRLAGLLDMATTISYRVWLAMEKNYRDGLAAGKKRATL